MNKNIAGKTALLSAFAIIISCSVIAVNVNASTKETYSESETKVWTNNVMDNSPAENNTEIPVAPETPVFKSEKDEIWHKMLNTTDYIKCVSGKFFYSDSEDESLCIEYQTDLENSQAYTSVSENSSGEYSIEVFTDGTALITLDNINKTALIDEYGVLTRENSGPIDDDERVVKEEDGQNGYYYRCDITNTYLAKLSLLPQEIAFGFLTDFNLWDTDGIKEYMGRKCFVVSGKTSESYGNKIGVSTFEFYVDCETGVLLKYTGFDKNGNVHAYLLTDNIKFSDNLSDIRKPDMSDYEIIKN